jgi:NADH dehydrogenase
MINLPETGQERIVIVGGGFAGLKLARKLRNSGYQVVLLDKNNFHQFQPLFYQVAMAGLEPSSIVFPFRKLFQGRKDVFFRIVEVREVDRPNKQLHTNVGIVNYDHLVLAMGADTNFFGNEAIAEHAIPMKSVSEALFLRNRILADLELALMERDAGERQKLMDMVIVGGGPTGVEVAGALAEMRKYVLPKDYPELNAEEMDIFLLEGLDQLLAGMSEASGKQAREYLEGLGVVVKLNTMVTGYDGETVQTQSGDAFKAYKLI